MMVLALWCWQVMASPSDFSPHSALALARRGEGGDLSILDVFCATRSTWRFVISQISQGGCDQEGIKGYMY